MESETQKNVLVLRFSSAGDIVLTAPAMHALRKAWPAAQIYFAVKSGFVPLVEGNPDLDTILPVSSTRAFVSDVRRKARTMPEERWHAILDLQGKVRSRLTRGLVPAAKRVVWIKRPARDNLPVRLGIRPYRAEKPIADRYHDAVETLVGHTLPRGPLRYFVGRRYQEEADTALSNVDEPIVGISPGATWQTKRWPTERFAALATYIANAGFRVVITGSPDELDLAKSISQLEPRVITLTGKTSLGALGGLIHRCRAFVANDSGPMHIARALGVPTLAFFGSTDPRQFEFHGHRVLHEPVPCAPCHFHGRHRCPKKHFRCLMDIRVDQAWESLQELLRVERERVDWVNA